MAVLEAYPSAKEMWHCLHLEHSFGEEAYFPSDWLLSEIPRTDEYSIFRMSLLALTRLICCVGMSLTFVELIPPMGRGLVRGVPPFGALGSIIVLFNQ